MPSCTALNAAAHGDLGLPVAHVAADQAVHRDRAFHVVLDVVDGLQLVGRLLERERLLDLVLPGSVGPEGPARCRQSPAIQHDELFGDLAHRAADPGPLLLEVGATHAVERRGLATGVLAHQAHLIGGHVDLAVLELEPQVVALDAGHRERLHLEVPTDAVLMVHDVVTGLERLVVVVTAASTTRATVHAPTPGEVGFGDERELHTREHHPAFEGRDEEPHRARRRLAGRDVESFAGQDVVQSLRRPRPLSGEDDAVAIAQQRAQSARQGVGVADDRIERARRHARRVGVLGGREQRHRARTGVREQPVEVERESREVALPAGAPGHGERARQRCFLVEQFLGAVAHPLGFDEQHHRVVRQQIGQQVFAIGEPGQPRLHAVEHLTFGESFPLLAPPRLFRDQRGGALPHVVRREQLPGREDVRLRNFVSRALVGNREGGEPVDLVAPQVDAHRMVVGRRVDVDDGPPYGHLAPRFHLVFAPVAAGDEARHQLVAIDLVPGPDHHRLDVLRVGPQPLHERPDRCDDHRRGCSRSQPPHHPQAAAHRLQRRRHPFEGQGLPRREVLDVVGAEELHEVAHQALGLGPGRHRDEDRSPAGRARNRGHEH